MATASEMLDWLGRLQFLSSPQVEELRPLLANFADDRALAKELIVRDWLTPYQVNQILQGKQDQLVLGDYRLRERLGEGAMGQIFKAWNLRLQRTVAIKTIHKQLVASPKAMDRFRREMEAAAQLDHPNIALVRDADNIDGRLFLVMDYIDGFNLSAHIKQNGPLPIPQAVEYARQVALGLEHAFERGIVHRDIKPSNLLVTTTKVNSESLPLVKILDFGLARFDSEASETDRLTQLGNLLGTVDYVAPEQAQNARGADIRADIYSLGCTLYYMLTAQPPFQGDNVVEKIGPRLTGEPPSVRAVRPEVPEALDAVLRNVMARRPDDRPQTPAEVARLLEPFAAPSLSGVPTAQPVQPDAVIAGSIPLAMPIASAAPPEAPAEDAAFLGMTATGRDMSSPAAAAIPNATKSGKPLPLKRIVLFGSGLAFFFVACLGSCMLSGFFQAPEDKKVTGTLRITEAKFSMKPPQVKDGERKSVLVYFQRIDFKGAVRISLADLPAGVRSEPRMAPPNTDREQVYFTVSYGTDPIETPIRVIVESDKGDVRAETTLTLKIVK